MKTKKKILVSALAAIITGITLLSIFLVVSMLIDWLPNQLAFALAVLFLMAALSYTFYREISKPESTEEPEYLDEDEIPMRAYKVCEFQTFNSWVNHASSWLCNYDGEDIICIDKLGYRCYIGEQFMHARDHDLFPVTCYAFIKNTEVHKPENKE